jgi:hypothetical protein
MKVIACALALFSFYAPAFSENVVKYGNWTFDNSINGLQIARTSNGEESYTGVMCAIASDGCYAYIASDTECEIGVVYPMMLNSAIGANTLELECEEIGNFKILIASDFEVMIRAFESGSEIGFALPMKSGKFHVTRFSTAGATAALRAARTKAELTKKPAKAAKPKELL